MCRKIEKVRGFDPREEKQEEHLERRGQSKTK